MAAKTTKTSNQVKNLEIGDQYRTLTLRAEDVDEENRTIELSFSSETPVERWWGMETLGHEPDELDLSRLNDAHPFLMDHKLSDQRGVIESAWIDGKTGRAVVRLSKNERGTELLNDMRDGIRTKISVGYRIIEIIHQKRDENGLDWYRCKWQPYEISSVSVPADTNVGVGRQQDEDTHSKRTFTIQLRGIQTMEDDDVIETSEVQTPAKPTAPGGERQGGAPAPVTDPAPDAERTRCREIFALGRQFGMESQADEAVANGTSMDEFRKAVLKNVRSDKGSKPTGTDMDLGLTDKEQKRYSLMSAVRANMSGNWKKAGFEREVSVALAEKCGKDARGFMVNYEVLGGIRAGQAAKTTGKGAELVANELHSDKFIELLRPQSLAARLGVRIVTGLVGNVDMPKLLSGSSFYWIDEGDDAPESDATFGIVQMSPKTVAGAVPLTRRLLAQSTPHIDTLMIDDIMQGVGLAIDKAVFVGTGAGSEPLGIKNQTGVNAIDLATLGLTHAGLVAFETAIEEADALTGQLNYLCRPTTKGTLKTTLTNANASTYLWHKNELNGYPAHAMKWLNDNAMLAGDFRQAMFGTWGVLDLMVDKATKAASGGTVLRVFQDGDVAVRHAKAFAYGEKP